MKLKIILPAMTLVFVGLMSNCEKDEINENSTDANYSIENIAELINSYAQNTSTNSKRQKVLKF